MGRRSRQNRPARPARTATEPPPARPKRARAADELTGARRTIAAYIVAAGMLGVLTLAGIATLGGQLGPVLVFGVVLTLAFVLHRNVARRIAGMELTEEDRLMRLLATGVLAMAVVLSLISAVVSLVAAR